MIIVAGICFFQTFTLGIVTTQQTMLHFLMIILELIDAARTSNEWWLKTTLTLAFSIQGQIAHAALACTSGF